MFRAALLLCILSHHSVLFAQEVFDYAPFTEDDEIELVHGPHLLELAATAGQRIRIPLQYPSQIAIVQELVEVNIDCEPWFRQFEGGEVQWRRSFEDGSELSQEFTSEEDLANQRVVIDERWYNISRTIIIQGAEDSDVGTYTCSVCTDIDTPNQICNDSKLELFLAGFAPILEKALDDEPDEDSTPTFIVHDIGSNFCLNRGANERVSLRCHIVPESIEEGRPLSFPIPVRTWTKDGAEIYSEVNGVSPMFNMTFLMNNPACIPGAVLPQPMDIVQSIGNLLLDTEAFNVSMPLLVPGVDDSNVKDAVFEKLLGTYSCLVKNEYGFDQAQSVITECDDAPEATTTEAPEPQETTEPVTECPDVSGNLYFELNRKTYQSGSSILITEVGAFSGSTGSFNPDSSLVCVTSEVNSQCCRMRDGGNVGEWHFPDGSIVQRNRGGDFSRSAYSEQVRLSRRNDAVSPVGEYTCVVPREDGCGGLMHTGTISLVLPVPRSVMGLCVITVWSPPEGSRFDFFTGYDVRFFIDGSEGDIIVNKGNEFFHLTTDDIRELGPEEEILVQVRAVAGDGAGPWTEPVALCPP